MSIDKDDDITEDDVASGFLLFNNGFEAGVEYEIASLKHMLNSIIIQIDDAPYREMILAALRRLELDYYIDPEWQKRGHPIRYEGRDEAPFNAWRNIHPRKPSSPFWQIPEDPRC